MEEFCYIFRDTDDVKDVKEVIGMVDNYFALQEKRCSRCRFGCV